LDSRATEASGGTTPAPLVSWASRGAGGVGLITAVLYLGILLGEADPSQVPEAIAWFAVMAGAGLLAWFADRAEPRIGRWIVVGAGVLFLVLGVLAIFSIGILYLIACSLALYSLSGGIRSADSKKDDRGR
jgi:hypothetical protein